MAKSAALNIRTYVRAVIAVAMMVIWGLVTTSGFLLWLASHGPRSGFQLLLFDLTKREWGELHVWFSFVAITITVAHLIVDWRGLCGCMKYLASVHRNEDLGAGAPSTSSRSNQPT